MGNEIDRFDKPKKPVTILGAADTQSPSNPKILDRTTKQVPVTPEVVVHSEEIFEDDRVRISPRPSTSPRIRLRASDQEAWEKAKRGVD